MIIRFAQSTWYPRKNGLLDSIFLCSLGFLFIQSSIGRLSIKFKRVKHKLWHIKRLRLENFKMEIRFELHNMNLFIVATLSIFAEISFTKHALNFYAEHLLHFG